MSQMISAMQDIIGHNGGVIDEPAKSTGIEDTLDDNYESVEENSTEIANLDATPVDDPAANICIINGQRTYIYTCPDMSCSKVFANKKDLLIHKYHHKDSYDISCNVCKKVMNSEFSLKKHMKMHDPKYKQKSCNICGINFDHNRDLEDHHRLTHLNEKPFRCDICGATFSWSENLKRHARAHLQETHRCVHCNKGFVDQRRLDVHLSKEHAHVGLANPDFPFTCPICDRAFRFDFSYKAHLQSHAPCDIEAANVSDRNPLKKPNHDIHKKYACKACEKRFASHDIFQQHIKLHEIAEIQILNIGEQNNIPNAKEFFVQLTTDNCPTSDGKENHKMLKVTDESSDGKLSAEVAAISGISIDKLDNTNDIVEVLDSHDENLEKLFEKFDNENMVNEAKKFKYDFAMIDNHPYKCDHCSKSFRWEVSLNTHMREHTDPGSVRRNRRTRTSRRVGGVGGAGPSNIAGPSKMLLPSSHNDEDILDKIQLHTTLQEGELLWNNEESREVINEGTIITIRSDDEDSDDITNIQQSIQGQTDSPLHQISKDQSIVLIEASPQTIHLEQFTHL